MILSAGRLAQYKNVHRGIEALAELDESFVLRVIGDGAARASLESLAATLGVDIAWSSLGT